MGTVPVNAPSRIIAGRKYHLWDTHMTQRAARNHVQALKGKFKGSIAARIPGAPLQYAWGVWVR